MLLAAACPASFTNLLTNGGFEQPTAAVPFETLSTAIVPGWSIASGTQVDLINGYWKSFEGTQSLDLNGPGPSSISQSLTTTKGVWYKLSFMYSGNPVQGGLKTMDVLWGSSLVAQPSYDTSTWGNTVSTPGDPGDMKWQSASYWVKGTGGSTALTFAGTSLGPCGVALDDVMFGVPEPSSWLLLGLAVGVPLWFRRRKRS